MNARRRKILPVLSLLALTTCSIRPHVWDFRSVPENSFTSRGRSVDLARVAAKILRKLGLSPEVAELDLDTGDVTLTTRRSVVTENRSALQFRVAYKVELRQTSDSPGDRCTLVRIYRLVEVRGRYDSKWTEYDAPEIIAVVAQSSRKIMSIPTDIEPLLLTFQGPCAEPAN